MDKQDQADFAKSFRSYLDIVVGSHKHTHQNRRGVSLTIAELEARLKPRVTAISADSVEITWDRTHTTSTHSIPELELAVVRRGIDPSNSMQRDERQLRLAEAFLVLEYAKAARNWQFSRESA